MDDFHRRGDPGDPLSLPAGGAVAGQHERGTDPLARAAEGIGQGFAVRAAGVQPEPSRLGREPGIGQVTGLRKQPIGVQQLSVTRLQKMPLRFYIGRVPLKPSPCNRGGDPVSHDLTKARIAGRR